MRGDRLFQFISCALIALGISFAFSHLTTLGLSWDEYLDWRIVDTLARTHDVFANLSDPSQGRFAHLIAACSFACFGFSYAAFKVPFVLIGCVGGGLVFIAFKRRFSFAIALALTAYYFTNPYVLGSMRTAATAGDVLVLVLSLAFVLSLDRWITSRDFWRAGVVCAVVCGAAVGAKWTNGLCVPLALTAFVLTRREAWGELAKDALCFLLLAGLTALATNPTFLLGYKFVLGALAHAHGYDHGTRLYLGSFVASPQWYFVPAVFVAKYGVLFLLVLVVAVSWAVRYRRRAPTIVWVSLATLAFVVPFALKSFQSAYYYIFTVAPCLVLAGWFLHQSAPWKRGLTAWMFLAATIVQAGQSFAVAPDFLHAGAEYGAVFEGEFWGPAVNHCQGGPALLEKAALVEASAPIYTLTDCAEILSFDAVHGPLRSRAHIADYPAVAPKGPFLLAVHRVYFVGGDSAAAREQRFSRFGAISNACSEVSEPNQPYRLFRCP